jgi:hypothetical protein
MIRQKGSAMALKNKIGKESLFGLLFSKCLPLKNVQDNARML